MKKRRGIFLIAILFLSLLVAMFAGAAIATAPAGLGQAAHESRLLAADRAARTGLAWAMARLRSEPDWKAATPLTQADSDLILQERDGQVVGWVREGSAWHRFRLRFNWQDGAAAATPSTPSDGLGDPAQPWTDMPLVSCNNFARSSPIEIREATGAGSSVTPTAPLRMELPQQCTLVSVEGAAGRVLLDGAGRPAELAPGYQSRNLEVVLKLSGPNQGITPAALMAAGDITVQLQASASSKLELLASSTQATRLRTKGALSVVQGANPNVTSTLGDLRANALTNITTNGTSTKVSSAVEQSGEGFYSIPFSEVKVPSNAATPEAGVYVVNAAGQVTYYDMNYAEYKTKAAAGTLPAGTPKSIPGVTVSTSASSPKVRMTVGQDLDIQATAAASDFVIVPDGGAPVNNTTYDHSQATVNVQSLFNDHLPTWLSPFSNANAFSGWVNIFPDLPGVVNVSNTWSWTAANGGTVNLNPSTLKFNSAGPWNSVAAMDFAGAIAATFDPNVPTATTNLNDYNYLANQAGAPQYTPVLDLPAAGELTPSELQMTFQGADNSSLVVRNEGSLVFGSQVVGNGAALVSKQDIELIGTSSELTSTPGQAIGLNLYAQGNLLIDSFKLDSAGNADFRKVNLKGVVYSWGNVTINVGDATVPPGKWGDLLLEGTLVAFGGDPANAVPGYSGVNSPGRISVSARAAQMRFDPSYIMGLYENLPSPLAMKVSSWHQR